MPHKDPIKRKEYFRQYAIKHREEKREQVRKYSKTEKGREAARKRVLKYNYGITHQQYEELFKQQNGCCAICGNVEEVEICGRRTLSVDHNHKTGKVRGLLCRKCNRALGELDADNFGIDLLCSAISYLRNSDE